jgi:hypothetical protein
VTEKHTSSYGSSTGKSPDVSLLRQQRQQAQESGDTAKVAELDQQISQAQQSQGGSAQQ